MAKSNARLLADFTNNLNTSGEVTANGLAADAVVTTFPFYQENGTSDTITVTSGTFPFYKEDGTQDNIGVS